MKIPGRFVLIIEGVGYRVRRRHNVTPGSLPYLIAHLLAADEMDLSVFAAFGLRVSVEADTDQGDDGPDAMAGEG